MNSIVDAFVEHNYIFIPIWDAEAVPHVSDAPTLPNFLVYSGGWREPCLVSLDSTAADCQCIPHIPPKIKNKTIRAVIDQEVDHTRSF